MYTCHRCENQPEFMNFDEYAEHREQHQMESIQRLISQAMAPYANYYVYQTAIEVAKAALTTGQPVPVVMETFREAVQAIMESKLYASGG